jgi:hypothetical protein
VQEQQNWMSAIVAAYGDPLLDAADGCERCLFDALGGSLPVHRSGDKKQSDARRGDTSHVVYDGRGTLLVAAEGITVAIG